MAARGAEFIGTMAVQEKHRFDVAALERFMAPMSKASARRSWSSSSAAGRATRPTA